MPTRFNQLQIKFLLPFLVGLLAMNTLFAQQTDSIQQCGSEFSYEQLMNSSNQEFRTRYRKLDNFTKNYIKRLDSLTRNAGIADDRSSVIVIPVVVHVVYNTPSQYISDAQVQSQIDALNRDFRENECGCRYDSRRLCAIGCRLPDRVQACRERSQLYAYYRNYENTHRRYGIYFSIT